MGAAVVSLAAAAPKRMSQKQASDNATPAQPRLTVPPGLIDAEAELVSGLIADSEDGHFVQTDLPVLISFAQASLLAQRSGAAMADDPKAISTFEMAVRLQAMLATRLRLNPASRRDRKAPAGFQPPSWMR